MNKEYKRYYLDYNSPKIKIWVCGDLTCNLSNIEEYIDWLNVYGMFPGKYKLIEKREDGFIYEAGEDFGGSYLIYLRPI